MKIVIRSLVLIFSPIAFAQSSEYLVTKIPDSLKNNAHAVIRLDDTEITLESQRSMKIKEKRVVTVLDQKGEAAMQAMAYYDKSTKINNIEARVFNALGIEIKKIKKKDFRDFSLVGGSNFISDGRLLTLDYTAISYPFTIEFTCESTTSNTAFIPVWRPISGYESSLEKAILKMNFLPQLGIHKKESALEGFKVLKTTDTDSQLVYEVTNIPVQRQEDLSFSPELLFPSVKVAFENFHIEGVDGSAKNWTDFGKWYNEKLATGITELPETTKQQIKALVANVNDPIEKAKIVYSYVQQKVRYVSIQLGIGGWKPMLASDVDRLGYGDCKALSNYTRALLQVVGVDSYLTILYGDEDKRNIESDIVRMQGNHMILAVPNGSNYIWLECTSQDSPFGYQGDFTDDRDVLVIKPNGAEIARTQVYSDQVNLQRRTGKYSIDADAGIKAAVSIASTGTRYSDESQVKRGMPDEQKDYFKSKWRNISELKLNKMSFEENKEAVCFVENLELSAANYGTISGNRVLFVVNAFGRNMNDLKRIRNRKNKVVFERGYVNEDEFEIELPANCQIEAMPQGVDMKGKFAHYTTEYKKLEGNKLVFKRRMQVFSGTYLPTEYDELRLFNEQVIKNDNAKIVLTKI